jgi:hypothetical protein
MIIAVNGILVGGMTTVGLEIELERSGPELILTLSRYKFADELRTAEVEWEQDCLKTSDAALNDDRRLDWTDICVAPISAPIEKFTAKAIAEFVQDDDQTSIVGGRKNMVAGERTAARGNALANQISNGNTDCISIAVSENIASRGRKSNPRQSSKINALCCSDDRFPSSNSAQDNVQESGESVSTLGLSPANRQTWDEQSKRNLANSVLDRHNASAGQTSTRVVPSGTSRPEMADVRQELAVNQMKGLKEASKAECTVKDLGTIVQRRTVSFSSKSKSRRVDKSMYAAHNSVCTHDDESSIDLLSGDEDAETDDGNACKYE